MRTHSNMVPERYRTPYNLGMYLVRKDLRSGETFLVSVKEDGSPQVADWRYAAIGADGTTFAYSSGDTETPSLFYRDLASGVRRVTTLPWRWFIESIALSADGRRLTWADLGEYGETRLNRHDIHAGTTELLEECTDWARGCWRYPGSVRSDDSGTRFLSYYRASHDQPFRTTLFDTATGERRALAEGSGYRISGDGQWLFYVVRPVEHRFQLKKVSTRPGAAPVVLRTWEEDSRTLDVGVDSVDRAGSLVGYYWLSRDQRNFAASKAHVQDQSTGVEVQLPEPRKGTAFVIHPTVSDDARFAVVKERCPWVTDCGPIGWYTISLDGSPAARG
ncbi:hypothetical protein [Saccharothrix australiensis]|uniref:hypothetical protein n=1 Tax=Saccharothrix australiensis TaxID=2072 RepID=UPI0011C40492|nr:hypothetical protein [Saccharothrix australiensis]